MRIFILSILCFVVSCESFNILAVFPHDGRSHHIFFASLVEELATRGHNVTVVNYHPVKKIPKLRQILLQDTTEELITHNVDVQGQLKLMFSDILLAYDAAKAFEDIANTNCKKLMRNRQIQELLRTESYDVVLVEQFVTDCGLAISYKLNAPTVGMTTHILMPWTYSRLGAFNHPAFVPNRRCSSGTKPDLLNRIKSSIINFGLNYYYRNVIQKNDQAIINEIYPDVPSLEELGKNMSLILLNQFFPLTGPRLYGPNVIEIGGMHISGRNDEVDKDLQMFLNKSDTGVVFISFGTVAANFPRKITDEIKQMMEKSNLTFVWKTDITDWTPPSNVLVRKWLPQTALLCHPKIVAFVTHSGMLSTSEAIYCGVPIVGIPVIGDQFANGASAVESGLGVTLALATLDRHALDEGINTVLQDKFQMRAKELSQLWRDRPLSPMDTAIYWIEYAARNKGAVNLKPPTVDLPLHQYFMLDLILVFGVTVLILTLGITKTFALILSLFTIQKRADKSKIKTK